ncbi:tyrosine-protein kinase Wsck [Oratosquilla oratoria]|uniref:tyrosine-protein kinase Wsck n=1 Tax=Oratosquilla oratoria TaxID=337810 RepID=UPI003F7715BA
MWGDRTVQQVRWTLAVFLCFAFVTCHEMRKESLPFGCYSENGDNPDFSYKSPLTAENVSVDTCLEECRSKGLHFTALYGGNTCFCGDTFSHKTSNNCTIPCSSNSSQICGGDGAVIVYETNPGILSAPLNLRQLDTEKTDMLHIAWEHPIAGFKEIIEYVVNATSIFTYSERDPPRTVEAKFSRLTQVWLNGVHPGSKYVVEVRAASRDGLGYPASKEMWTKVGKPEVPHVPQLISKTSDSMVVELETVVATNGPITSYQVVVVDETAPVILQPDALTDYNKAMKVGLPYYITAEFTPENFYRRFTVGDGKMYGKYFNAPLISNVDHHILLGVISSLRNVTKSSYSVSDHSQHESSSLQHFDEHEDDHETAEVTRTPHDDNIVLGLSIAIGLFGFLLLSSIVVYAVLRVLVQKKQRRSSDHQELAEHADIPHQELENGYAIGAHYVDDEGPLIDHYQRLKERVKVIPHQGLTIVGDIGNGKFGEVKKGIMYQKGQPVNILVHRIQDNNLDEMNKSQMLRQFDAHVKINQHSHVVCLLGLMEEINFVSVAFEYESGTFKNTLVESRAVQHYPVYAEKHRRFSTLSETQVLDILTGVARGMAHLSSLGIVHGQLCSRNVVLVDGFHPKVTGFGLIHYHNDLYVPDYQRWQAVETLRTKLSKPKSDVWSFGCLMWEAVTLGGTPYSDVRTEDVAGRIVRGLRLAQPQYVGDNLYQLMLFCWQTDLDERPTFEHLEQSLNSFAGDDITPHLLFSLYPAFQYEQYAPNLEFLD